MRGVGGSVDRVGFEAKGGVIETALTMVKAEGGSGEVIRQAIASTRRGGTVSFPGLCTGFIHAFLIGDTFEKGLTFKCGQTHVQRHMFKLLEHILASALRPDILISHRISLADAAKGYRIFD